MCPTTMTMSYIYIAITLLVVVGLMHMTISNFISLNCLCTLPSVFHETLRLLAQPAIVIQCLICVNYWADNIHMPHVESASICVLDPSLCRYQS